jgi:hypothetical protein
MYSSRDGIRWIGLGNQCIQSELRYHRRRPPRPSAGKAAQCDSAGPGLPTALPLYVAPPAQAFHRHRSCVYLPVRMPRFSIGDTTPPPSSWSKPASGSEPFKFRSDSSEPMRGTGWRRVSWSPAPRAGGSGATTSSNMCKISRCRPGPTAWSGSVPSHPARSHMRYCLVQYLNGPD